ncbi:MAG: AMP-binding protein [Actinomycetota bacterium]
MTVDGSVLAPFDRIVAATPDALAVIDADGTPLTYRQLRQAADHFAARLPIEPGEMVGLSMPRCANLVAAMVGIVRASGVYVPFSGDEPPQRRAALQARLGLRYWVDGEVSCLRDGEPPILDATAFGTGDDLPL